MKPNKTRLNWVNSEPTWPIEPVFFASRPANQFSLLFFGWMDRDGLAPFSFLFSVLFFFASLSLSLSLDCQTFFDDFRRPRWQSVVLLEKRIVFYWLALSFTEFSSCFTGFYRVLLGLT